MTGATIQVQSKRKTVSILDGATLRVRRMIHGFREPRYTAAHPDRRHAYVTDSGTSEVVAVDLERGAAVGRVKLDEWARHVTIDPAGFRSGNLNAAVAR